MMYANWANDPDVTRFLRWEPHKNWMVTAEYLAEVARHYGEPDFYEWGITLRATGELIGTVCLCRCEPERPGAWKFPARAALGEAWEPGYVIGPNWQGRGYATEALDAVCSHWFGPVGGLWLAAHHANPNVASAAVLQKAGFVYDHTTEYHRFDGTARPCRAHYRLAQG